MPRLLSTALLLLTVLVAVPAHAGKPSHEEDLPLDLPLDLPPPPPPEEPPTPPPSTPAAPSQPQFLVGVQLGPSFPGIFNRLGTSGIGNVQAAWQLPFMQRELGVFFQLGYTQPSVSGTRVDPRLTGNGGVETWRLSVMDFALSFGADYVLQLPAGFIGFGALGLTVHLTHSVLDQSVGKESLGTASENSTRIGYVARLGAGYHLGPGYLTLELENEFAGIDHRLTGVANTAHLAPALGYLLRL